jgi:ATP-dependent helicase/nuclease subunit B
MGNARLFTEPSGEYYFFRKEILAHINSNEEDHYLYILPVNRAVRYFKKNLLSQSGRTALIDPPVYTFGSFVRFIYSKSPSAKQIIPASTRLIYIHRLLEKHQNEFQYLKYRPSSPSGLVSKTAQMLSEMSQFGMRPGNFHEPPPSAEAKYQDLTKLLILLHDLYGEDSIDESMLISEVSDGLDIELVHRLFPNLKKIYINGYGIYTPPMLELVKKLSENYQVNIQLEYDTDNESLFKHTYNAFDALKPLVSTTRKKSDNASDLQKFLFTNRVPDKINPNYKKKFTIRSLPVREDEVRFIAGTIRDIFQKENVPLHKMAVTFPDLEKYASLIRKVFAEFEIPYNLSTGFRLSQSPLIQAYLQIIALRISNFEIGNMEKLLLSPFLHPDHRINIRQYHQITREHRIKRFNGSWREKLNLSDDKDPEMVTEFAQKISKICEIILHLDSVTRRDELPGVFLETLDRLGMLQWFDWEKDELSRSEKEREFRAYNRFYKLLNQIALIKSDEKVTLHDFRNILHLVLRDATYNLKEWSNYGVQCMPRLEVQSLESEILFIGGLVEGEFPRGLKRDIFFNDDERNQLGLYAVEDLLAQDRFLFFQLLSSGAKCNYLLYPQTEDDTVLLPSSFIRNFREVCSVDLTIDKIPDENLINRKNIPEYLTSKIRSVLPEDEIKKMRTWASVIDNNAKKYMYETIDISYTKYNRSEFNSYEGNLSSNQNILDYLDEKNRSGLFSITALELYAFCPMKYFLQRVLHLPEDEEDEEEIFNAMERGSLIHQILFEFFTQLKKENKQNVPWNHHELLYDIANNYLSVLPYEGITWTLEKEKILGGESRKGLLKTFLETEQAEINGHRFFPDLFEFGFGIKQIKGESDTRSVTKPLQIQRGNATIKLSGKIDRIDKDDEGRAIVIDYKTGKGKNAGIKEMYEGTSLQLPVYIAAVNQLLSNNQPVGGVYYQIHDADHCKRIAAISDSIAAPGLIKRGHGKLPNSSYPIELSELIESSIDHVFSHLNNMTRGFFNHTKYPENEGCQTYCAFRRICRKDVAKLKTIAEEEEL